MKIFVLGTRGFPNVQGGVEKHCEELFQRLASRENEVTVLTRTPYIPKNERIGKWKGIKFVHLWCPKAKSLEAIIHSLLGAIIARFYSPDILHIHAIGPATVTPLARLLGLNVVLTHHGPDYERQKWGKLAKYVLRFGEKMGVRYANKVIAISEVIKNSIEAKYKRNDSYLIYNGITKPERISPGSILKKYDLIPGNYIFTACRFVPEKGLTELIQAYSKIETDSKLVISGAADHVTDYSRTVEELAAKYNVVLTGNVFGPELGELFSNAGLFVLPSYYEGLPIALLEALSYDLPVLISDIPAHMEIQLNPERYFKVGNEEALIEKMECLLHKPLTSDELNYNRKILQEKYDWDVISDQVISVYQSVLT